MLFYNALLLRGLLIAEDHCTDVNGDILSSLALSMYSQLEGEREREDTLSYVLLDGVVY